MAYPIVVIKQPSRKPLYLQVRASCEIGRECDGVLLADPQVSRRHASIDLVGDMVVVEDLGSTNGTLLDGQRCTSAVALRPGSVVRVGDTTIELVLERAGSGEIPDGLSSARQTTVTGTPGDDGRVRASGDRLGRETSIDVLARVADEVPPPQLTPDEFEGTITIVFSDIESSTERATSMGDTAWMKVLNRHNEIIRRRLKEWRGKEVKNQGDGFMLTFAGVHRALKCMIAIQQDLAADASKNPKDGVRIRVGMHTGEVIVESGDIFGKHVMMAARVGGVALGGEILVSALVREIASARGDIAFGEPRAATFKGIEGEHFVYPVLWEEYSPE
ncbi:MAG TPA: adenylate/guanylate cyclase domain-containing protein [Acidimicrobiia bacterium]|nr:adenylate/guanylate cyclase domain-containing protein [Acidimicrobiia bacterium]